MTIEDLYNIYLKYPIVCTDTRKIIKNSLFFALKGSNFDGNTYWKEALDKGARYAIVNDITLKEKEGCIWFENTLVALQQLAQFHRKKIKITILAITGTNGKTTTKELIRAVLGIKKNTKATSGNLNNHIGVPLTLLSFTKETEIGIVEMGANHQGEIDFLCNIAYPDYGIITNIGMAHIEGFGSFEGVIETKTELYRFISKNKGIIFCNINNDILVKKINEFKCQAIYYGSLENSLACEILKNSPYLKLKAKSKTNSIEFKTKLIGNYNLENIEAALCIGLHFGIGLKDGTKTISRYKPENMRSQWLKTKNNNIIVDAYNANPTSMKYAIDNFDSLNLPNKTIILGDMLELGNSEEKEHATVIDSLSISNYVKTILIGRIFNRLNNNPDILSFNNVNELIDSNLLKKIYGNNILLKGSRGIGLEKVIDFL